MLSRYISQMYVPISEERLSAYRSSSGNELDLVANYFWNILLSEALYPSLNASEVALRNSIHRTLSEHYQDDHWFDLPNLLEGTQQRQLANAREKIRIYRRGSPRTAGMHVAELTFGFWVGMLNRPYERKIWRGANFKLLHAAFPSAPRKMRRLPALRDRYSRIVRLRNRVFHYEPVWNQENLSVTHREILEAIGWISPVMRDTVHLFDRFPDTYHQGHDVAEQRVNEMLKFGRH